MPDTPRRAAVAHRAATDGAATAAALVDDVADGTGVETKSSAVDVVTEADRAAQAAVVDRLRAAYPDEPVVAEEASDRTTDALPEGPAWVVDPIDGTRQFVRRLPVWTTGVAFVRDGDPRAAATVAPASGTTHVADGDGTRRDGAPASVSRETDPDACMVAMVWHCSPTGYRTASERFGGVFRFYCVHASLAAVADGGLAGVFTDRSPHPWDALPGVALVRQAGGRVTDIDGERWTQGAEGFVASSGEAPVHERLVAAAREARAERRAGE